MSDSKQNRQELKKKLRWGDIEKIVSITGISRATVDRWFLGQAESDEIKDTVDAIIEKRKKNRLQNLNTIL